MTQTKIKHFRLTNHLRQDGALKCHPCSWEQTKRKLTKQVWLKIDLSIGAEQIENAASGLRRQRSGSTHLALNCMLRVKRLSLCTGRRQEGGAMINRRPVSRTGANGRKQIKCMHFKFKLSLFVYGCTSVLFCSSRSGLAAAAAAVMLCPGIQRIIVGDGGSDAAGKVRFWWDY